MGSKRLLPLFLLVACQRQAVVATAGETRLTAEEIKQRLSSGPPRGAIKSADDLKQFVLAELENDVLAAEAARLGLKIPPIPGQDIDKLPEARKKQLIAAVMKDKIAQELRTTIADTDVTDEEIYSLYKGNPSYPYYPARVMVIGDIFKRRADAERFYADAKGTAKQASDKFREAYQKHAVRIMKEVPIDKNGAAGVETWDFEVTRSPESQWPKELVEPAFAGKAGDIVGPFTGKSSRYQEERSYVLRIEHNLPESNTFQQVKERLRETAMHAKVLRETEKSARDRTAKLAKFDEEALATLLASLGHQAPQGQGQQPPPGAENRPQ